MQFENNQFQKIIKNFFEKENYKIFIETKTYSCQKIQTEKYIKNDIPFLLNKVKILI